jgi:hypothetical protein
VSPEEGEVDDEGDEDETDDPSEEVLREAFLHTTSRTKTKESECVSSWSRLPRKSRRKKLTIVNG